MGPNGKQKENNTTKYTSELLPPYTRSSIRPGEGWYDEAQYLVAKKLAAGPVYVKSASPSGSLSKQEISILREMRHLGLADFDVAIEEEGSKVRLRQIVRLTSTGRRLYLEDRLLRTPVIGGAIRFVSRLLY